MDPELRAYLEAMEQRAVARDAETRGEIKATRAIAEAALAAGTAAREEAAAARREAGVRHDAIIAEIRALPEGLSTFQRQEAGRLVAAREEAMLTTHVLPLEASVANHERRIAALEHETR